MDVSGRGGAEITHKNSQTSNEGLLLLVAAVSHVVIAQLDRSDVTQIIHTVYISKSTLRIQCVRILDKHFSFEEGPGLIFSL